MSKHTCGPWRVHDVNPDAWTRQVWTDEGSGSVMITTAGGVDKNANALRGLRSQARRILRPVRNVQVNARAIFKPACGRRDALILVCLWPGVAMSGRGPWWLRVMGRLGW